MSKELSGAVIGFVVCSGLAFLVGAIEFASFDSVDGMLPFLAAIVIGSLGGFVGAEIGGSLAAGPEQRNSPRRSRKWCKICGSRLWDNPKTCKWCGAEVC